MTRTCSDCPTPISAKSKGRCRSCACKQMNTDAAILDRRKAKHALLQNDPAYRRRHAAACAEAKHRAMQDPAIVEKMREAGRRVGSRNFAAANTPEARERARIAIKRRHLAWCPEEFWPLNATLKRAGCLLDERKRMIADEAAAASRRESSKKQVDNRAMSPFERQLERVRQGAALVEKFQPRRADYEFTLGGNATGMI